ncbi:MULTISPECIES: CHAT domain-containing protein [unclassified Coleofasciculus]|uniref:CHAT domain-containing protein n=1 Tax=unclassified Coleofasciculus TaxID=2692782 RepID=UPI0018816817|nr:MULTISPECIES: tetratricopeptide repeat protein [unclassified Coleofasciculus]MBE9128386.1 tetratricopeptide repeat protein [Coleofasciculus sp. LEGE 07081]MBE9147906.1 tetratricopeptide repeat protein [Coleofasciculus sp. LEGE 07092]
MHQSLKSLSLVTVTVLLSLVSPRSLAETTAEISSVLAQELMPQDYQATANVEGTWNITEAKTTDGRNYTGTVTIQPIGQIYSLSWQTSAGNQLGLAFLENDRLFVAWGSDEASGYGLGVYKIGGDGNLDGRWTYSKAGGEIGTEIATGGRPDQIEGNYQVTGTNPGSEGQYKGNLNIRKTGDTYQLAWTVGATYRGVGIRSGDWLLVSWGQSSQFGVVDYTISGDKAKGRLAIVNQSSLGIENLVRTQTSANLSLLCTLEHTPIIQDRKAEADCLLEQGIKQIDTNRFQLALQPLQQALAIYREIQDRQGEGQTLKNLGNAYFYSLKDYTKAIEYQQQALAIAREIKDRDLEARALLNTGIAYKELGESVEAIAYYQQSLAIAREIQSHEIEWKALNNLGIVYSSLKDSTKAIEYQQQVLAIARELQNHDLEWTALSALVSSYDSLKDYHKVVEFAQQGLTFARETQNQERERLALNTLISAYTFLGNQTQAIEYQQQILALARKLQDQDLEWSALSALVGSYDSLKDYQKVIEFAQQGLTFAREAQNRDRELAALITLSSAYYSLEEYEKVIESAQAGLAVARQIGNRAIEARALGFIGDAYSSLQDYPKAIELYQQSLVIAKEIEDRYREGAVSIALSRTYNSLNELQKVIEFAQAGLAVAQQIENRDIEARALAFIGDAYTSLENYQQAIEAAQQALVIAQETENGLLEAYAFDTLSRAYSSLNDYQKSVELARQQLEVAQRIKNSWFEGRALARLGDVYKLLGEVGKAIELAQQGLVIAREIKNRYLEAWNLITLGDAYDLIGDNRKAIEFAQQGLTFAQEIKNRHLELLALSTLGGAYNSLGDYQKSIEFLQQNLTLARELRERDSEAIALVNLSNTYDSLEDYQKAIELLQQSLTIAREIKDRRLEAQALGNLSGIYASLNDYEKALEVANQGLEIAQEIQNYQVLMRSLYSLSVIYEILGNYPKLVQISEQSLATARELQNPQLEAASLAILGLAYFYQGDTQKTIEFAQASLTVSDESNSQLAKSIAILVMSVSYGELKNYDKAIELSEENLKLAQESNDINLERATLNILGAIYRKAGQNEKSLAAYQKVLAMGLESESHTSRVMAQAGLARTYRELNMPITAITHYKQAINGIEQIRSNIRGLSPELQESFLQSIIDFDRFKTADIYRELADLLLSQGRILEAQQVLELLKVQELRDFTRNTRAGGEKQKVTFNQTEEQIKNEHGTLIAFGQKVTECEETSCSQLDQLLAQQDILTEEFNQSVETIEKEVRDRISTDPATLDSEDFLRKANEIVEAQPGTVLIYPLVLEDKIWLLWAAKGGIVKSIEVSDVGQRQLGETVVNFRQLLQNPSSDIAELQATGKQLYDWLIKPLESELKSNTIQNLVFSLDRAARYIPMSALFDGEKYLIENYTISTVLSADLTNTDKRLPPGTENTSVLAMGLSNAVAGFNPLPNVPPELDAIVLNADNDPLGVYSGSQFLNQEFNLETLRKNLRGNQILHLATHGEFNPGRPEDSYLVLGNGDKFAIPEISKLYRQLSDVHLVVLSACETALGGSDADGNEINGISYYFLNYGAEAVMASLWLVDDASTSQLMQQFYSNLANGTDAAPITKAEALRQAQLSLLHNDTLTTETTDPRASIEVRLRPGSQAANRTASGFSHPYYWAPFILIGNSL